MPNSSSHDVPTLGAAFRQLGRLVSLIRPYWSQLLKGMLLGPVVGIVGMITPYLTKLLIDEVYPSQDVTLMHVLVGGVLAVSVASALTKAIQGYFNLYVKARLGNTVRLLFFNHLQYLPMRFFNAHRVGEVTSRFQDVEKALGSLTKIFQTIFGQGVYLLLVPPFLFLLQWKLALVALISIPLTVTVTTLAGRALRTYWKRTSEAYADLNALQVETLSQIRMLKSLALEHHIFRKASDQLNYALSTYLRAGGLGHIVSTSNGLLKALNTALFTWLGWTLILSQEMTLGSYIAFTSYIGFMYNPMSQLVRLFSDFQHSAVNFSRMFEYLDEPTEQDPATAFEALPPVRHRLDGHVELRHVTFGYTPGQRVLKYISLTIEPSALTSIVGPSGSGKTTLLRMLTRLERPDEGEVFFDGVPASQIDLADLRRQVGVVWQEFSLLEGTIWDNLTLGLDNVSQTVVDRAVRLCRIDGLIRDLPRRYETPVAEWGASLSGGQRQRMALARTIIRDTPILILDEATSNIDVETERRILDGLFAELEDTTIIFVTHRVATASRADQVCVLDTGKVVDVGSHDALLSRCALYRRMQRHTSSTQENGQTRNPEPLSAPDARPNDTP